MTDFQIQRNEIQTLPEGNPSFFVSCAASRLKGGCGRSVARHSRRPQSGGRKADDRESKPHLLHLERRWIPGQPCGLPGMTAVTLLRASDAPDVPDDSTMQNDLCAIP
jgi:hypothetical protein